MIRHGIRILVILTFVSGSVMAQQAQKCAQNKKPMLKLLEEELGLLLPKPKSKQEEAEEAAKRTPREAAASMQIAAPSSSTTSTGLVDGVGSTSLFGLALDNSYNAGKDGVVTLSINPFVFAMASNPDVFFNQSLYEKKAYEMLRRFDATVTLGGKGESFDRDGDGQIDDALVAENLDDIVGWEVRTRLGRNSRDRRERRNFSVFRGKVSRNARILLGEATLVITQSREWKARTVDLCEGTGPCVAACMSPVEWKAFVQENWFQDALPAVKQKIGEAQKKIDEGYEEAAGIIDNRPIFTFVVGGTSRKDGFGADEQKVALRGSWLGHTWNVEWTEKDGLMGASDPRVLKAGWEYSFLVMKGVLGKDGAKVSAGASYETFSNVPDAMHSTNSKASAKVELPLTESVTLPISITWANHKNLLSDDHELVGHFGIAVDFGSVFGKKEGKGD